MINLKLIYHSHESNYDLVGALGNEGEVGLIYVIKWLTIMLFLLNMIYEYNFGMVHLEVLV